MQTYARLARLRKELSFTSGDVQYAHVDDDVYSFMRFARNSAPYLVAVNIGNAPATVDFTLSTGTRSGKVVAYASPSQGAEGARRSFSVDATIDLSHVTLKPGDGVVFLLLLEIVMEPPSFE